MREPAINNNYPEAQKRKPSNGNGTQRGQHSEAHVPVHLGVVLELPPGNAALAYRTLASANNSFTQAALAERVVARRHARVSHHAQAARGARGNNSGVLPPKLVTLGHTVSQAHQMAHFKCSPRDSTALA